MNTVFVFLADYHGIRIYHTDAISTDIVVCFVFIVMLFCFFCKISGDNVTYFAIFLFNGECLNIDYSMVSIMCISDSTTLIFRFSNSRQRIISRMDIDIVGSYMSLISSSTLVRIYVIVGLS